MTFDVAAELEEFSPRIGRLAAAGDDETTLALDVGGTAHWFGGEAALLDRLRVWCRERHLAARAAVADTLGAAWAVAHYGLADDETAERHGGRSLQSVRVVPPGETIAALNPLPIDALCLSPPTVALLRELGLDTIEQLLALPRAALAERFDAELLSRLDQATGAAPEVFAAYRPPPQWEAGRAWEYGLADAAALAAVWEALLPKLLAPLAERGRGVARLLAELHGESGGARRLVLGLLRPSLDRRHLLDLLRLRLESVRVVEPIVGTKLSVLEEGPFGVRQQVLFDELSPPVESEAWTLLVERLTGRLGPDRVVAVRRQADHAPERAWRAEPWRGTGVGRATSRRAAAPQATEDPPRPTALLARPRSIRVVALAPQGHPQRFHDSGCEARVVRSWGPERIETGWWRGPSLRRDYYRVETDAGTHCWLFRDLRTRAWFLHGWFD